MKLQNPWPADKRITSPYGYRIHPITKKRTLHRGCDVAGSFPVTAAEEGVVEHVGYSPNGGGHVVIIKHGASLYTVYYHGRTATKLRRGDRVQAGDFIYDSGSTGASTGAHLHFEVRTSRAWGTQVDPENYLNASAPVGGPLPVNGRLDRATIIRWQELLKANGHNVGLADGRIGARTVKAIQESLNVRPDGSSQLGPVTIKALQKKLGVKEDGDMGRITISALQRAINAGKI